MPKRPGRLRKGADPDVLSIAKGGIAVLVGPIQRRGRFEMPEGCTVIAAIHQSMSEDAMALCRFLDACQLSVPSPSLLPASKNLHRVASVTADLATEDLPARCQ